MCLTLQFLGRPTSREQWKSQSVPKTEIENPLVKKRDGLCMSSVCHSNYLDEVTTAVSVLLRRKFRDISELLSGTVNLNTRLPKLEAFSIFFSPFFLSLLSSFPPSLLLFFFPPLLPFFYSSLLLQIPAFRPPSLLLDLFV